MLLDYILHTNVANGLDVIDKVRQYAVSKGWTQEEWRSGYDWDENPLYPGTDPINRYAWTAYTGCCYLHLTSTGYGTTPLNVRLAITHQASYSQVWNWFVGALHDPDDAYTSTNDGTSQLHPYIQRASTGIFTQSSPTERGPGMDLGNAVIDRVWIFGDSKWICCVLDMDGVQCQAFHFGQFEMFESSPTCGSVFGFQAQKGSIAEPTRWEYHDVSDGTTDNPARGVCWWPGTFAVYLTRYQSTLEILYDDVDSTGISHLQSSGTVNIVCNLFIPYGSGPHEYSTYDRMRKYCNRVSSTVSSTSFPNYLKTLNLNTYSGKRPMAKVVYAVLSSNDGSWIPICKSGAYIVNFSGLDIGEVLTYGSQEYICFPLAHITDEFGFAIRIA